MGYWAQLDALLPGEAQETDWRNLSIAGCSTPRRSSENRLEEPVSILNFHSALGTGLSMVVSELG